MDGKEKNGNGYTFEDISLVKIDFDVLSSWHNPVSDLPVCSFISFYQASGIVDDIEKYSKEHDNVQVTCFDNILCNSMTLKQIKNFLEDQWGYYSLDIDADNHVFWDTQKYPEWMRHYKKALKKKIKASLIQDFMNYCPGVDDDLEDNQIVFRVFKKNESQD